MPQRKFLVNRSQGKQFRLDGISPSESLPHNPRLCTAFSDHVVLTADSLPPKTDLRPAMTPVDYQDQIGSCTANCLAGAYEYLTKQANGQDTPVSRLFIYYNGRFNATNNSVVTDTGCTMSDGVQALEGWGACLESLWPYDIQQVNTRPGDDTYAAAKSHTISEAMRVNIDLNEMKTCLAQGYPFAFGLKLYSSFDQAAVGGVVPMPGENDTSRESHGSHALLAVGYSDASQAFIVRNSWGARWGVDGYCYIPYAYVANQEYSFDVWTLRKVADDDIGQNYRSDDDSYNYREANEGGAADEDDRSIELIDVDEQPGEET